MSYKPTPPPASLQEFPRYLRSELERIASDLADNSTAVFYRTIRPSEASPTVTGAASANWKVAGNVLRVSTSATQTFTGLQRGSQDKYREVVFVNVGTGVAVLKREAAESSASNRFAIVRDMSLSQNGAVTLWRDPFSARWRALSSHS